MLESPRSRLSHILARFQQAEPNPRCELYYETPFQLLISVVLSAQTTDKMVNRCMEPVYRGGFTPDDALKLGEAGVLQMIRSIGLANTKAKRVVAIAGILRSAYDDTVPATRAELEALPGVGRKTASVILGELFGQPTMAVDTHVFRVGQRLGLHKAKTAEKAEVALLKLIDPKWLPAAHHWLILHGRYTCLARKPKCGTCLVSDLCPVRHDVAI